MRAHRAIFPLAAMCGCWVSPPAGTMTGCAARPRRRARRDAELKGGFLTKWIESGGIYGCPQIHAALRAGGEGVTRRRFKTGTTKRDAGARTAPDW